MKNDMLGASSVGISMHGSYRKVAHKFEMRFQAKGHVKAQILNPDQSVARVVEVDNLILNQGLNYVATRKWCDNFLYCVAGSGATAISVTGGATTAVQAGTVVTLSGGAFTFTDTATDAGRVLRWDTGQVARVVTITSPTVANVDVSQSILAGTFVVYNTQQVGLTTEIVRSNTYVTGAGNCGTTLATNVFTHKRTFDFPTEVGGVTYREIGFSYTASAANNLFSRVKLPLDLVLVAGQILRVVYSLQLTVTPYAPSAKAASITGWPVAPATDVNGSEQIQLWGLSSLDTNGATVAHDLGGYVNEPSDATTAYVFLSTDASALAAIGSSADRTGVSPAEKNATLTSYVSLSNTLDKTVMYDTSEGNSTVIRTIGLGRTEAAYHSYTSNSFAFLFGQAQTKDNQHTLTINFTFAWGRDLS